MIAFRREPHNSRGGPCGGRGGDGGSIYFQADQGLTTLMDFKYKREYTARRGAHGGGNSRTGRSGDDMIIRVPAGTLITDADTGEVIADLTEHGSRVLAAGGGKGGRGNESFASPTRRSPDFAEDGEPGQQRGVQLELKLLADVGLVGFPNSGKSTLLSRISEARPKVADYPFTTLTPNLGVAVSGVDSFVVADIPGLIEGAQSGKGLGHEFLRHIERTKILVMLIDISVPDPRDQYRILCKELAGYSDQLPCKPRCLAFSKMDLVEPGSPLPEVDDKELFLTTGISAVTGMGLEELKRSLAARLAETRSAESKAENAV